jgi:hypothetical protein
MPKFWLTEERTQTIRTLVEAPSAQAVDKYYRLKDTDWTSTDARESTEHTIVDVSNNQRYTDTPPDERIDADGEPIDEEI